MNIQTPIIDLTDTWGYGRYNNIAIVDLSILYYSKFTTIIQLLTVILDSEQIDECIDFTMI